MATQAVDLVGERGFRNFEILRLPLRPSFPEIAAAPTRHYQDALPVCQIEELLGLQLALQPDRVQSHVEDVSELVLEPLRVFPKHHMRLASPLGPVRRFNLAHPKLLIP